MDDNITQDTVLIVEDDESLRELLTEELTDAGYQVLAVGDARKAALMLEKHDVQLIISDLRLPGDTGLDLLGHIRSTSSQQNSPGPGFIMVTAFGTVEQAVDALKQGADDFLTKPIKLDHLRISADRVIQRRRLQEELARYKALIDDQEFHGILGRSRAMQQLFNNIRMVARAGGPVLISGESGTGKELVARAIHAESDRNNAPFIAINCAGIPPALLESELFGHTATAFTGAQKARQGLFAEADGGSLLLDEIGEMPVEMQAKLLRILQDGRIRPVGADQEKQLDVRILAATNRKLEQEVSDGRFREDLYFRLQTFAIEVPALRDRDDDLDLLIAHFIRRVSLQQNKNITAIDEPALLRLRQYDFPGNVRELASTIERAVTFCQGSEIGLQDMPERLRHASSTLSTPKISDTDTAEIGDRTSQESVFLELINRLEGSQPDPEKWTSLPSLEQAYIDYTLQRFKGNKRQTANALGIGRRTLYRKLGDDTDAETGDHS
ncbi:MAG TPA: sigma-54-dependent Fis family transcriptional regulator [Pseudohongiella sp.]|nr:sigma-54-dependent Fis family transcriptional regulator [Gammaproteobacteria bacterium]HBN13825.1 sigma-54-dependent Fis family transcriptional regulator [Pseudohongiella sp.]